MAVMNPRPWHIPIPKEWKLETYIKERWDPDKLQPWQVAQAAVECEVDAADALEDWGHGRSFGKVW